MGKSKGDVTMKWNANIKPIPTEYNGYLFRSRLEARWAVFFDKIGINYKYETEGYDLGGTYYLPDFWLPHSVEGLADDGWGFWIEIKPVPINDVDLEKVIKLSKHTKHNALIFQGNPWPNEYEITKISTMHFDPYLINTGLRFVKSDNGHVGLRNSNGFSSFPSTCCLMKDHEFLNTAFKIARQAQFEHGKQPTPSKLPSAR